MLGPILGDKKAYCRQKVKGLSISVLFQKSTMRSPISVFIRVM